MNLSKKQSIKIWDGATRLWHWSLVVLLIFLWYSADIADDLMNWHMRAGRLLLALIIFRIVWGFIGSDTAKFVQFIRSPKEIGVYLKSIVLKNKNDSTTKQTPSIGHNPAGGIMVLLLITGLLLQAVSGLFTSDGYFYEGPFANSLSNDWLSETLINIHHSGFNILIALIVTHLFAVFIHLVKGHNLIRPMITGFKSTTKEETRPTELPTIEQPTIKSPILSLVVAAIIIAGVWFITA